LFDNVAAWVALGCEAAAVLVLALGAGQLIAALAFRPGRWTDMAAKKRAWLDFAGWILIALELTLASDIVRTALTPGWTQIGQLGAIAAIRTGLSLFLERDIQSSILTRADAPAAQTSADQA
jgi:uncharacterized membrane protein